MFLLVSILGLLLYLLWFNLKEGIPTREATLKELKHVIDSHPNPLVSRWISIRESDNNVDKLIRIHYIQNTNTDKSQPAIYFLHGTRGYSWSYRDLLHRLKDYRCFAIDLPGYGISDTPSWHNETNAIVYKEMGQLLSRCISTITPNEKVIFVGHSFGSFLLTSLIQESPELVERVILCATPGLFPSLGRYSWYYGMAFLYNVPFGLFSHDVGSFLFFQWLYQKYDRFTAYFMTQLYSREVNYVGLFIRKENNRLLWSLPQIENLEKTQIPIALVCGEYDTIIPVEQAKMVSRVCPLIRTYIMKGEGHFCQKNGSIMESIVRREIKSERNNSNQEDTERKELLHFLAELNHPQRLVHYGASMSIEDSERRIKEYFELLLEYSNNVLDYVVIEPDLVMYESCGNKK